MEQRQRGRLAGQRLQHCHPGLPLQHLLIAVCLSCLPPLSSLLGGVQEEAGVRRKQGIHVEQCEQPGRVRAACGDCETCAKGDQGKPLCRHQASAVFVAPSFWLVAPAAGSLVQAASAAAGPTAQAVAVCKLLRQLSLLPAQRLHVPLPRAATHPPRHSPTSAAECMSRNRMRPATCPWTE